MTRFEFYGTLDEWTDSIEWRHGEELAPDLVASYEAEIMKAAREVIERIDAYQK